MARPFRTAWPDSGRRLIQGPVIDALLRDASKSAHPATILNAGAGEGMYTQMLLDLPDTQSLVEFDVSYAQARRPRIDRRQQLIGASLTAIPLATAWADLTLCSEVLEHVVDDRAGLRELARTTKVGGALIMSVPTPPAPFDPNHVREGYTASELTDLLREVGFKVVQVTYCMRAAFKLMLRWWRIVPWIPKPAMWMLMQLERKGQLGRPMDLVVVAHRFKRSDELDN